MNQLIHKKGGNYYDDMRIDLDIAFKDVIENCKKTSYKVRRSIITCLFHSLVEMLKYKCNARESRVIVGKDREWFEEFKVFWEDYLGGAQ